MTKKPEKAYKNLHFLNSSQARHIRILCEYEEPKQRFHEEGIHHTLVFFGSARIRPPEDAQVLVQAAEAAHAAAPADPKAAADLKRARAVARMSDYYEDARNLSRRLTLWSMERHGWHYTICSGGGPGIMEAANRGASDVPGGRSIGLGISLPFEEGCNPWVSPDLAFEFHYFFTRKLWFLYMAKGLVVFPGGFGTMDELFETLTLIQTGKIKRKIPVVLFGSDYWSKVIDLEAMAEFGTISPSDIDLVLRTDSVDEAFDYLTRELDQLEHDPHPAKKLL